MFRYVIGMHKIIEALKAARIAKGLSTRAMASRLGVSQAAISAWERGTREPIWADVERWAADLGVSVRVSIDAPGPPPPPTASEEAALLVASMDPDTAAMLVAQLRAAAAVRTTIADNLSRKREAG